MKKQFQIGHVQLEIQMPDDMLIPENMKKFEKLLDDSSAAQTEENEEKLEKVSDNLLTALEEGNKRVYYKIDFVQELQVIEKKLREEHTIKSELCRDTIRILNMGDKECRILNFHGASNPYAICLETEENKILVWVDEGIRGMLIYDTVFVSLLLLEKVMIKNNALILHSAYMCRNDKAVLFSAPSETGKSTQADLWEKYRQTRTINGDKSLLIREDDGWYAYGWPVCGSSEICNNEDYPIHAIVMLHQAKENSVERLKGFALIQKLMAQITINMWNSEFQIKAMDLIEQLVGEVPVYELGCDISEEAVECLEKVL